MSVFGKPVIICTFSLTSQEYTMSGYISHKKDRKEINAALFYQLEKDLYKILSKSVIYSLFAPPLCLKKTIYNLNL